MYEDVLGVSTSLYTLLLLLNRMGITTHRSKRSFLVSLFWIVHADIHFGIKFSSRCDNRYLMSFFAGISYSCSLATVPHRLIHVNTDENRLLIAIKWKTYSISFMWPFRLIQFFSATFPAFLLFLSLSFSLFCCVIRSHFPPSINTHSHFLSLSHSTPIQKCINIIFYRY